MEGWPQAAGAPLKSQLLQNQLQDSPQVIVHQRPCFIKGVNNAPPHRVVVQIIRSAQVRHLLGGLAQGGLDQWAGTTEPPSDPCPRGGRDRHGAPCRILVLPKVSAGCSSSYLQSSQTECPRVSPPRRQSGPSVKISLKKEGKKGKRCLSPSNPHGVPTREHQDKATEQLTWRLPTRGPSPLCSGHSGAQAGNGIAAPVPSWSRGRGLGHPGIQLPWSISRKNRPTPIPDTGPWGCPSQARERDRVAGLGDTTAARSLWGTQGSPSTRDPAGRAVCDCPPVCMRLPASQLSRSDRDGAWKRGSAAAFLSAHATLCFHGATHQAGIHGCPRHGNHVLRARRMHFCIRTGKQFWGGETQVLQMLPWQRLPAPRSASTSRRQGECASPSPAAAAKQCGPGQTQICR